MIGLRTLRGKLALGYATALLIALLAFSAGTLAAVHELRKTTLDDRIESATRALIALTTSRRGTLTLVGTTDHVRFTRIIGTRLSGAIIARDGRVVMSSVTVLPQAIRALAAHPPPVTALQRLQVGAETWRIGVTPVPRLVEPIGVAVTWRTVDAVGDVDRRMALVFALAIPLLVGFALVAGNVVAARGLRPLRTLAALASEIEAHDLSRRLVFASTPDELGLLCATFDRMLDRLEEGFARERRFTTDASHELRAPLAVIRAEADLTLRRPREGEEYERALRAISAQCDRLEALTRDLLAEARTESAARVVRAAEDTAIDLGEIARDVADRLAPLAQQLGVKLRVSREGAAAVCAAHDTLHRAVLCIVHNALKFARATVTVSVRGDEFSRTGSIVVSDDGPGFSADGLAHASERFWRDQQARSRPTISDFAGSGTGLGLAIARSLVESAHGTVQLANHAGGGAEVTLVLPRVEAAQPA